jgi:two-component system invasion response regulator UvrY
MVRILVADDHAVVRQGVQRILQDELPSAELGEAKSVDEVLALLRSGIWDLLILDINMPGRSGLEALQDIKDMQHKPRVLVLSMHPEDQLAQRVIKAGASGYLTKDTAPEELLVAVNKILSGGKYISFTLAEQLVGELQGESGQDAHKNLSDREYEVLRLIGSGKTPSQIAEILALSPKTVSTYRSRLLHKMGMETNAELIHYAVRHGIVD